MSANRLLLTHDFSKALTFLVMLAGALLWAVPSMAQGRTAGYQKASLGADTGQGRAHEGSHGSYDSVQAPELRAEKVAAVRFADQGALDEFYASRGRKPYWTGRYGLHDRAENFIRALEISWTHGLNPYQYHLEDIRAMIRNPAELNPDDLELLLSDAFVRYARDLTGIRAAPDVMKLDRKHWRQPLSARESLAILESETGMDKILEKIEPQSRTYKALQKELIRLSREDVPAYEHLLPIGFGGLMKPGWGHKAVPKLRARLGLAQPERNKTTYDDALAAAVMKFQRENGLEADGVIGANTLQMLNLSRRDRMLQIIANLERLRWVEPEKPERFIVVNIPSQTLWAVEDGRAAIEMPVVVGSPWRRTRIFKADITGVRFNPDWTIPPTVLRHDILPKVREDINYLSDKGIEIVEGFGSDRRTLDPLAIDWQTISWAELSRLRLIQIPGEHNPLGRIRILMPNDYNMYLHDTNHPELFAKPERALSSGCIRMSDPARVAGFVMQGTPGWGRGSLEEILAFGETLDVDIEEKIPVYILYYTAWIGEKGQVVYGPDIYNYDRKLVDSLSALDGILLPLHNDRINAGRTGAESVALAR